MASRTSLFLALHARRGHWVAISDVMWDAGFRAKKRDRLTPFTAFYFHLEQLKSRYPIVKDGDRVMLVDASA